VARCYDLPLYGVGPRKQRILDCGCPMDCDLAVDPEEFIKLADIEPTECSGAQCGYCMLEDGSGYVAVYKYFPNVKPEMTSWWFRWMNFYAKEQPDGTGNIKYKIWCPPGHFDDGFINGTDASDGVYSIVHRDP